MLTWKRKSDIIKYCWKDSKKVTELSKGKQSRWGAFLDMIRFSFKYEKDNRDYMKLAYYDKSAEERLSLDPTLKEQLRVKQFRDAELAFHSKWISPKWEHPKRFYKRTLAYQKHFNAGAGLSVRYDVWIFSTHERIGTIKIGKKVGFAKHTEIDYTGDLTIGNGVDIAERTIIFTHSHDFYGLIPDEEIISMKTRAYATPLVIEDNVFIGAQCIIMPGVGRIGENSVISAGSVVTKEVPPNTIVAGNPAKNIGKLPSRALYLYDKESHKK